MKNSNWVFKLAFSVLKKFIGTTNDGESPVWQPDQNDEKGIAYDSVCLGLSLDKISPSAKYVGFFATSAAVSGVRLRKGGDFVMCLTWEKEATCRVVDNGSRKELMCLKIGQQQSPAGVLLLMIVRGQNQDQWEIWPCSKFFKPRMPYGKPAIGEKDCIEFFSKFIANGEVNKMFNVK